MISQHPLITLPQATEVLLRFTQKLSWCFRGQTDATWDLVPRAGRKPFYRKSAPVNEDLPVSPENPPPDLGRFNHWRQLSVGYCDDVPQNDFHCLAFAQHYGLPTRLLDFTENALTALYFACEGEFEKDGAVYAHHPKSFIDSEKADLFRLGLNACLRVPPFDRRILAQRGVFIYFADPAVSLCPTPIDPAVGSLSGVSVDLIKFIVPAKAKLVIFRQLQDVGMTRRTVFPDLEGLSHDFIQEDEYRDAFRKTENP